MSLLYLKINPIKIQRGKVIKETENRSYKELYINI